MQDPSPRKRPIVEVRGLRKEYPLGDETVVALKHIDLSIMRGEICCIFGTSGSGKSTLLNQLAGMEKPTRGEVRIGGAPISRMSEEQLAAFRQRHLGFVFQSYNLLPSLTAAENVAMPLLFRGVPPAQRDAAARAMLKRVGLGHRMDHYPAQMSGGHRPRLPGPAGRGVRRRTHRQPGFQDHRGSHGDDLRLRAGFPPDHHPGHPRPGDGPLCRPHRDPHRRPDRVGGSETKERAVT